MTNSSGSVVSTTELDPWGATVSNFSNNDAFQPRKFTSYERDGNHSDEAMFRRYNRWQSRFDQPDPYDGSYSLTNPQSFNRYAYVQGDPVNFVDPTGLDEGGPPDCGPGTVAQKDARGDWQCVGAGVSEVTVTGSWDDMSAYLPDWTAGSSNNFHFGFIPLQPQDPVPASHPTPTPTPKPQTKPVPQKLTDCLAEAAATHRSQIIGVRDELRTDLFGPKAVGGYAGALLLGGPGGVALGFYSNLAISGFYGYGQRVGFRRGYVRAKANCHSLYDPR